MTSALRVGLPSLMIRKVNDMQELRGRAEELRERIAQLLERL